MRTPSLLLFAGLFGLAACSSDNSVTSPSSTATTGSSTSSNGYTIAVDSATANDTVTVATVIPVRVHVTQNGVVAANMSVSWAVASGGGTVSAASSVTDSSGTATVNWTMGDTARVNTLTASITGASVTISATAIGGAPSALVKVSVDSEAVVSGGTVPLTARAVDRFGNAAPGVGVTWSSDGGSLSARTTTTGSTGDAVANFTTGAPGVYLVTAAIPGSASVTFKVVAF